jgi:hypothetical protein
MLQWRFFKIGQTSSKIDRTFLCTGRKNILRPGNTVPARVPGGTQTLTYYLTPIAKFFVLIFSASS